MVCKFCNTENPDEARFCSACGRRIDGKISCPKCGKENAEGAAFCIFCGSRMDGKRVCPSCGELLPEEANFCPVCGHAPQQEGQALPAREEAAQQEAKIGPAKPLSHWLNLSGGIALIGAAVFSLIFVFCLGLTVNISGGSASSVAGLGISADISVYDHFSKVYENIRSSLASYPQYNEYYAYSLYFRTALGTLTAAMALIAVPLYTLIACIRFARAVSGKPSNSDYFRPAAMAYGIFLGCACTFLALYSFRIEYEGSGTIAIAMNGATLAGLIVGGLFFGAGAGLTLAAKEKISRKTLTHGIFAAAGTIAAIIVMVFTARGTIGFRETSDSGNGNILYFMSLVGMNYIANMQNAGVGALVKAPDDCVALSVFTQLFQIAVIVLTAAVLISAWKNIAKEKNSNLKLTIALAVSAVLMLVFGIVCGNCYLNSMYGETAALAEFSYTAPIVALVFAALLLAGGIADFVLSRPKQQTGPLE